MKEREQKTFYRTVMEGTGRERERERASIEEHRGKETILSVERDARLLGAWRERDGGGGSFK